MPQGLHPITVAKSRLHIIDPVNERYGLFSTVTSGLPVTRAHSRQAKIIGRQSSDFNAVTVRPCDIP
jgi:hypothetical protein